MLCLSHDTWPPLSQGKFRKPSAGWLLFYYLLLIASLRVSLLYLCVWFVFSVFLGTCTSRLIILLLCDLRVFKFLPCISLVGTALNLDRPVFFLNWQVKTSFSITFMGYYTSENNCTGQWRCQITGHRYNIKGSPDLAAGPPGCASPVFLIGLPLCNTSTLS